MLLAERNIDLETSSDVKIQSFKIKTSSKAFEILSSGIYSDSITAIIREISTNAADSHIAAKKKHIPFVVHLPNEIEPFFSVKDEGTGIPPDALQDVFITYFESDKTHSNDFTGCLGLGSKSPFSYVDNFIVTSVYNGKKTICNCFLNKQAVPSMAILGTTNTQEPNGVEVKLAVKLQDFDNFFKKAHEVLKYFDPLPEVIGAYNFKFNKCEYLVVKDNYKIFKEYGNKSHIVMGNVAYPIKSYLFSNVNNELINWGIDIYVEVGDVDFASSREELKINEKTTACVRSHLKNAVSLFTNEIAKDISKAPTLWSARRLCYDLRHSVVGRIAKLDNVYWNGINVSENIELNETVQVQNICKTKKSYKLYDFKEGEKIVPDGRPIFHADIIAYKAAAKRGMYYTQLNKKEYNDGYVVLFCNQSFLDSSGIGEVMENVSKFPLEKGPVNPRGIPFYLFQSKNSNHWQRTTEEPKEGLHVRTLYGLLKLYDRQLKLVDFVNLINKLKTITVVPNIYKISSKVKTNLISLEDWLDNFKQLNKNLLDDLSKRFDYAENQWRISTEMMDFFESVYVPDDIKELFKEYQTCRDLYAEKKLDNYACVFNLLGWIKPVNRITKIFDEIYEKYPVFRYLNWDQHNIGFHNFMKKQLNNTCAAIGNPKRSQRKKLNLSQKQKSSQNA